VDRVVKKCAARAGLGPGYGGHSLRAGCATWLAECGVPIPVIARHGRWAKLDMVLTYARGDTARALAGIY
jgi:integrase